jgi:alpha-L-rhamnosidase
MGYEFTAQMISPDGDFDGAPLLRRVVRLDEGHGEPVRGELHASALGVFEAYLSGRPVSEDVLSPGWSSYEWRLRYQSYDVTALLDEVTVLGFALGNGWYRGRLGWSGQRALYGDELGVLAELVVTFADGHLQKVVTDTSWQAGPSAVIANDLYDGQTIDARRYDHEWLEVGAALPGWAGVHTVAFDTARLTPYLGPPVRRHEAIPPVAITTSPSGKTLVDFGQNLVGWVRCTVQGDSGTTVTLRHAEVLEHGELGTRPLRSAEATDRLVLSGGRDTFEPTKTFHGFRYVQVDGWPGELSGDDIEAVVVHSELTRTGEFECSDPLLNQLHDNAVWGLRGNFLDLPTDCPQRDERLGWTGDIAVFAPAAAYLYDVATFLDDWLADLAAEQAAAGGRVPYVIPDALKFRGMEPAFREAPETTALWGDAAAFVPWTLWQAYGDHDALLRHYPAIAAHVRHVARLLSPSDLWDTGFQFGDWLDPQAPPDKPADARADKGVVATACYFRTLNIATRAALVLGNGPDAAEFAELQERVGAAFRANYVGADARIESDCPTVYALAIVFGLLSLEENTQAGARLAELVADDAFRAATGFAGTPYILDALSSTGQLEAAYRMLLERQCPSWLYTVTMGATTLWERWDSMLPDGSINPGEMTSFNHYAFGAVVDWMHRTIGGISPLEPGYSRVLVAPQPGGGLTWARASLETRLGRVATEWHQTGESLRIDVAVPAGAIAVLRLPGAADVELPPGEHVIERAHVPTA